MAFVKDQVFIRAVDFVVSHPIGVEEVLITGFGIPEVEGEVGERAGGIGEEFSAPEVRIALEEPDPGTIASIGTFKAFFTSWLDFELP
jgi:hypothetical protein